jgi:hypothetical protein
MVRAELCQHGPPNYHQPGLMIFYKHYLDLVLMKKHLVDDALLGF